MAVVAYSFLVLASTLPSLHGLRDLALAPYYIFVPGYVLTSLLEREGRILGRAFYSVVWSLAIVAAVSALAGVFIQLQSLPLSFAVPAVTLALFGFAYFAGSRR